MSDAVAEPGAATTSVRRDFYDQAGGRGEYPAVVPNASPYQPTLWEIAGRVLDCTDLDHPMRWYAVTHGPGHLPNPAAAFAAVFGGKSGSLRFGAVEAVHRRDGITVLGPADVPLAGKPDAIFDQRTGAATTAAALGVEVFDLAAPARSPDQAFFDECCRAAEDSFTPVSELYSRYRGWCESAGVTHALTVSEFARRVTERFGAPTRVKETPDGPRTRGWGGVEVTDGQASERGEAERKIRELEERNARGIDRIETPPGTF